MPIKITFSAFALALTLLGCSSPPTGLPSGVVERIKRVSVVSIVGDELVRSYVGITVFGNEFHRHDISAWELNSAYEQQLEAELRNASRITVVPGRSGRTSIARADVKKDPLNWERIGKALEVQCRDIGVDGIFIVAREGDRGVGVWAFKRESAGLHVSATVSLFDCTTGKRVASNRLESGPPLGVFKNKLQSPSMKLLDNWPWYGEWDDKTLAEVRERLVDLPKPAWRYTLQQVLSGSSVD